MTTHYISRNLVKERSKEMKKTAILSILMLALMLAIMVLANDTSA